MRGNMARTPAIKTDTAVRIVLNVRSAGLTDDQFFRLCSDNRDLRIEMTAQKELIIM
jgi:Uma2 family endonuclease